MLLLSLFLPALIGGCWVALAAAPLGAFVIWRKQAYFGDALSHSALLGVALGLLFHLSVNGMVMGVCVVLSIALMLLQRQRMISSDALLGVIAHFSLALGLLLASVTQQNVDLMSYLFGDILAVHWADLSWMISAVCLVLAILWVLWPHLLAMTLDVELAQVEGTPVFWMQLVLMVLTAITVALAMKVVGILLITALMVIPAASARYWAKTPEQMVIIAGVFGCLSIFMGLLFSITIDAPAGPAIVVAAGSIFFMATLSQAVSCRRSK